EAGQLAALAGLGALSHLDLDLAALVQIFSRDAEAARGDLLDRRVGIVAVRTRMIALRVLAALARDRAGADAVHGDVQRLVGLGAEGAQRHAGVTKRLRISLTLSTSSTGIGTASRKSSRSRSAVEGSSRWR